MKLFWTIVVIAVVSVAVGFGWLVLHEEEPDPYQVSAYDKQMRDICAERGHVWGDTLEAFSDYVTSVDDYPDSTVITRFLSTQYYFVCPRCYNRIHETSYTDPETTVVWRKQRVKDNIKQLELK